MINLLRLLVEECTSFFICQILTLHDTPMSLQRHYRHHAVNTIRTLRALDRHLVSDEEIIEDATFGRKCRFGTMAKGEEQPDSPDTLPWNLYSVQYVTF
jgi:hypothetical protein